MTFKEWHDKYKIPCSGDNVKLLPDNEISGEMRIELYELTDYMVSYIENGLIWLVRRK